MTTDRELLEQAERALRELTQACITVAPTLKVPYRDAPETSPWDRFVHRRARTAYDCMARIRRRLQEDQ